MGSNTHEQAPIGLVHENTYKGVGPAAFVHRRRLRRTMRLFDRLERPEEGRLADFGCSNGFILSVLQSEVFRRKGWRFFGFDRSERLLMLAEAKNLPNTEFHRFDLNVRSDAWRDRFDVVTCLETLEHVGNYRNAVLNLYEACKPGGRIAISIPNERAFPGLVKYVARPLVRTRPYGDFFEGKSRLEYVWRLVSNSYIDSFRDPPSNGWGPHLGFDSKRFAEFLHEDLAGSGKCRLLASEASASMFNHFYLLQKIQ